MARYKLSDTKIKKAVKLVSSGVPQSRLYAGLGVTPRTVLNWIKEGKMSVDKGEKPKDESERLVRDFFLKVEKASIEAEMKDLEILGKHAKDDWRAAVKRLEIRNKVYNTRLQVSDADFDPDDEDDDWLDDDIP